MSKNANDVVIVSGCRTAIARFGGSLKALRAHQLAGVAMEEAIRRAGIAKDQIDEVIDVRAHESPGCPTGIIGVPVIDFVAVADSRSHVEMTLGLVLTPPDAIAGTAVTKH